MTDGNARKETLDNNRRKHLVARMAGNIAAGLSWVADNEAIGTDEDRQRIADTAVDIAERILKRIGL